MRAPSASLQWLPRFRHNPADCYEPFAPLADVDSYGSPLRGGVTGSSVVVLGGFDSDDVNDQNDGCIAGADVDAQCFASGGLSNFTASDQPCGPGQFEDSRGGLPCCTAEPAPRLGSLFDGSLDIDAAPVCADFRARLVAAF